MFAISPTPSVVTLYSFHYIIVPLSISLSLSTGMEWDWFLQTTQRNRSWDLNSMSFGLFSGHTLKELADPSYHSISYGTFFLLVQTHNNMTSILDGPSLNTELNYWIAQNKGVTEAPITFQNTGYLSKYVGKWSVFWWSSKQSGAHTIYLPINTVYCIYILQFLPGTH